MPMTFLSNKTCQACSGKMYFWHEPQNTVTPFMIACVDCGKVLYKGDDIMELNRHMGMTNTGNKKTVTSKYPVRIPPIPPSPTGRVPVNRPNQGFYPRHPTHLKDLVADFFKKPPEKPAKKWTMTEAYEANKKAEKCVVCGAPLSYHPSCSVLYCKCIESLPKEAVAS